MQKSDDEKAKLSSKNNIKNSPDQRTIRNLFGKLERIGNVAENLARLQLDWIHPISDDTSKYTDNRRTS